MPIDAEGLDIMIVEMAAFERLWPWRLYLEMDIISADF